MGGGRRWFVRKKKVMGLEKREYIEGGKEEGRAAGVNLQNCP